jgi:hypothetical protein
MNWFRSGTVAHRRFTTAAAAVFLPLAAAGLAAQREAPPAVVGRSATLTDKATANAKRAHGDAREFRVECRDGSVHCVLVMAKPLLEGTFTCAALLIDCDDKENTGLRGDELRIRGAVGSRFQPSAAAPTSGDRKAIDHTRVSSSILEDDGKGGKRWIHHDVEAPPPVVAGNELRFSFPLSLVRERGDRYGSRFSLSVRVHTSASDQPIELLHSGTDAGLPIVLDGADADWSGPEVVDRGDELHEHLRCADLTSLRVDHGPDQLLVAVGLAESGFAGWVEDGDVEGVPAITFHIEPMFPRYQRTLVAELKGGSKAFESPRGAWRATVGERCVEAAFPRAAGQGRFRVVVHSDVELVDYVRGRAVLDPEAK